MAAMGFGLVMGTSRWSRTRRLHSLCAKGSPLVYEEVPREPEDGQFVMVETAPPGVLVPGVDAAADPLADPPG